MCEKMEDNIKANGKMIISMDKEYIKFRPVKDIKVKLLG